MHSQLNNILKGKLLISKITKGYQLSWFCITVLTPTRILTSDTYIPYEFYPGFLLLDYCVHIPRLGTNRERTVTCCGILHV